MPIDYLERRKMAEQGVSGLVGGRDIDDELSKIQQNVTQSRQKFLEGASGLIKSKTSGRGIDISRIGELDERSQAVLARKRRELQVGKLQAIFNNAYNLAVQSGMDEDSAKDYANQIVEQQGAQTYEESERKKGRLHKTKLDELATRYGISEMGLLDEFTDSADLGPVLLSAILGTGTNVALNRYFKSQRAEKQTKSVYKPSQVAGVGGYEDYDKYYTPAINSKYGRTAGTSY